MTTSNVVAVANYHCITGENPLWNEREQRIYWEDIDSGRLFRADHSSPAHECFYEGPVVGGFTFQEDGDLLLFEADRIATLEPSTGNRRVVAAGFDADMERFNDVIADPEGRVFAGTIGKTDQSGGLYRVDLDGSVTCLWKGTGCSNGMGFTRDLSRFFWTCSTTRRIFVANYDRTTGAVTDRRLFYAAPESEGIPDGLAVDTEDNLWTARWGGSAVLELSPRAELCGRVEFPVPRVSSVTFGGPALDTLYVTTAGGRPGDDGEDGTLYRVHVDARGRAPFRSRIGL